MTLIEQAEAMAERLDHIRRDGCYCADKPKLASKLHPVCQGAAAIIRRMADELRKAGEYVDIERLGRG